MMEDKFSITPGMHSYPEGTEGFQVIEAMFRAGLIKGGVFSTVTVPGYSESKTVMICATKRASWAAEEGGDPGWLLEVVEVD